MSVGIDESLLVMTRIFDAPPERVFDAWMEHGQFESWIGPEGVKCEVPVMEPKVGGRYRVDMKMSDGTPIPVSGVYQTIERPKRIVFTWGWDGDPDRTSTITLTFQALGDKTKLTLRQEGLKTVENRDGHNKGWTGAFNKLAGYLAKESA
ncbi:MAG TPA: SRPBCC domain-containing protein [Rhizomicrobium sp.]|nr:SRPBCC domain-containing protein [Rhizomicrobium sp.]